MTTQQVSILEFIKQKGQVAGVEIAASFGISRQALFKHLRKLLESHQIFKIGKPPRVFYSAYEHKTSTPHQTVDVNDTDKDRIEKNFFIITPSGEKLEGISAFTFWCDKNNIPYNKTAQEYIQTLAKYELYKKNGLINGLEKMKNSFPTVYVDEVFYLDFYSIERFGKTKLGQLLLYAKQSQNQNLMNEIIQITKPVLEYIVKTFNIDGIGFIPPTIKREKQLMKVLESGLGQNIRRIAMEKIKTDVAVPQKTLSKLEDRIENASHTIVVKENSTFENILLIDDAIGSGATLNETAKKIRNKNICRGKIIGFAITGSFNGFDIISEV